MAYPFVEEIDDMFRRGMRPIPVEEIYTIDDLKKAMIEAVEANRKLSEEQKKHIIYNIKTYNLAERVWKESVMYHPIRLGPLGYIYEEMRLHPLVMAFGVPRKLEFVISAIASMFKIDKTVVEKDIELLIREGFLVSDGIYGELTPKGRKLAQGLMEELA